MIRGRMNNFRSDQTAQSTLLSEELQEPHVSTWICRDGRGAKLNGGWDRDSQEPRRGAMTGADDDDDEERERREALLLLLETGMRKGEQ